MNQAPGANLAVYSTDKGQGHVNKAGVMACFKAGWLKKITVSTDISDIWYIYIYNLCCFVNIVYCIYSQIWDCQYGTLVFFKPIDVFFILVRSKKQDKAPTRTVRRPWSSNCWPCPWWTTLWRLKSWPRRATKRSWWQLVTYEVIPANYTPIVTCKWDRFG